MQSLDQQVRTRLYSLYRGANVDISERWGEIVVLADGSAVLDLLEQFSPDDE